MGSSPSWRHGLKWSQINFLKESVTTPILGSAVQPHSNSLVGHFLNEADGVSDSGAPLACDDEDASRRFHIAGDWSVE
jgi:hypothetical protein